MKLFIECRKLSQLCVVNHVEGEHALHIQTTMHKIFIMIII